MNGSRRAMSLVELLVVVAIIGLLIALLLPAMARARERTKRAVCLSNLRGLFTAFNTYAGENSDQIPIGYRLTGEHERQLNYLIWDHDHDRITLFGLLYAAGYNTNGRQFYCPSMSADLFRQNSGVNFWPPGNADIHTRAGYGCRPVVAWPQSAMPARMAKLSASNHEAILADIVSLGTFVDQGHRDGVNVLYANGSAVWVDRAKIDSNLSQLSGPPFLTSTAVYFHDDSALPPRGVWFDFDK